MTDGEMTDRAELPRGGAVARAGVRLFPRAAAPDLAITRVTGPDRVAAGDTIRLEVEVRGFGAVPDSARVEVRSRSAGTRPAGVGLGGGWRPRCVLALGSAGRLG